MTPGQTPSPPTPCQTPPPPTPGRNTPPRPPAGTPPPNCPPPQVLKDSWGVGRIRTGCSRPPVQQPSRPCVLAQKLKIIRGNFGILQRPRKDTIFRASKAKPLALVLVLGRVLNENRAMRGLGPGDGVGGWLPVTMSRVNPPPKKNRNRFLFLAQLVAVAGGVLIFGGGPYCVVSQRQTGVGDTHCRQGSQLNHQC